MARLKIPADEKDSKELYLYSSLPPRPFFSSACSNVFGPRSAKFATLPRRRAEGAPAASIELSENVSTVSSASNANGHLAADLAKDLRRTFDAPQCLRAVATREGKFVEEPLQDTTSIPRRLPRPPQSYLREYQQRQEAHCEEQNAKVAHWENGLLFRHLQRMTEANEWSEELGLPTRYYSHKTPAEEVVCHIYEDGTYFKQVSLEFFERRYKALQSRYKHLAATRDFRAASTSSTALGGVCSLRDPDRSDGACGAGSHLDMAENQIIITMTMSSASQMNDDQLWDKTLAEAAAAKGLSADEVKTSWHIKSRTIKDRHGNCFRPCNKRESFEGLDFPLQVKHVFEHKASMPAKSRLSQEDQDLLQRRIRDATLDAMALADGLRQQLEALGGPAPCASSMHNLLAVH